jgi:hypothetical protein
MKNKLYHIVCSSCLSQTMTSAEKRLGMKEEYRQPPASASTTADRASFPAAPRTLECAKAISHADARRDSRLQRSPDRHF